MADAVEKIVEAVKESVQSVTHAVKEALHIPDNLEPLMATLKDLIAAGNKFAAGEGSKEELAKLTEKLKGLSGMVDSLDNGPIKKLVLTLRDQALSQLRNVKGAEKIVKILQVLGEDSKGDKEEESAAGGAAAAATEATAAAPSREEIMAAAVVADPSD